MIIGIACEDDGHFVAATCLVDAELLAHHSWLDGIIESCRSWRGLDGSQPWYKYDPRDAHDLRPVVLDGVTIKPHGLINGESLKPEAGMWRKVLLLFCHRAPRPEVVVLVRDMDGHRERWNGMEQARSAGCWPFEIVLAAPQPEIEAWYVAGFQPLDAAERDALADLRRVLSFDPTLQSHRLTSRPNDARTDAKRVLALLCRENRDRRSKCLSALPTLLQRGADNGVVAFLEEVQQRIVPRLGLRRG